MSFLAALDFAEVAGAGGDQRLPPIGWMLFFGDLDNDEALGFIDVAGNSERHPARALHVPPGVEPVAAPVPEEFADKPWPVLDAAGCGFEPHLTLPDAWSAGRALGLSKVERETYCEAFEAFMPAWSSNWIGGHATDVQDEPQDPGTVLLLILHGMNDDFGLSSSMAVPSNSAYRPKRSPTRTGTRSPPTQIPTEGRRRPTSVPARG